MIRLTREFSFEMSHVLGGYDGSCSEIHGHSYRLFVTVKGVPSADPADPKLGMVTDFGMLKRTIEELVVSVYDHSFIIRETPADAEFVAALRRRFTRIHVVGWQPTCENILVHLAAMIVPALPSGVALHSLRLHETANSFAEWFAEDQV
ncbi:MAG: 6-carboxytetrahydropterin synthase [Rikenellaceae bacterium]|nr:6-carboxytetrahydropterin synthase [Rikenellaceae bacterium]MCL2691832.1 6-carboxytetrahydropterin synthase [Rikenellaceae bacterium]